MAQTGRLERDVRASLRFYEEFSSAGEAPFLVVALDPREADLEGVTQGPAKTTHCWISLRTNKHFFNFGTKRPTSVTALRKKGLTLQSGLFVGFPFASSVEASSGTVFQLSNLSAAESSSDSAAVAKPCSGCSASATSTVATAQHLT